MFDPFKKMFNRSRDDTILLLVSQEWINLCFLGASEASSETDRCSHVVVPMRSKHGKCLSRPSLSISKDGRVETFEDIFDGLLDKVEHFLLHGVLVEDSIILTLDVVLPVCDPDGLQLFFVCVRVVDDFLHHLLVVQKGSHPDTDLDRLIVLLAFSTWHQRLAGLLCGAATIKVRVLGRLRTH